MLHDQGVSNSQFASIGIAEHNASCRASSSGRIGIIAGGAAGAAVDKEGTPSAHLAGLLGLEVKGARTLGGLVHDVHAISQLVSGGGERTGIDNALLSRIVVSLSLSRVAVGIDGVISRSTYKPSCVLVVVVGHGSAGRKGGAATLSARIIAKIFVPVEDVIDEGESLLSQFL